MALNPALRKMIADAHAKYGTSVDEADDTPREALLNVISNGLQRLHATPTTTLIDYPQEAMNLLEEIEMWAEGYDTNGYLIFSDPSSELETLG